MDFDEIFARRMSHVDTIVVGCGLYIADAR
jgi:hypothetical protein